MGIRSSDVYYINQDKKNAQMAALKGGAQVMAQDLRAQYNAKMAAKQEAMKKAAEDRQVAQKKLLEEDAAAKHKKQ